MSYDLKICLNVSLSYEYFPTTLVSSKGVKFKL